MTKKKYVNLEHAEEKLTEAIVILKKESDATQTDISTIMKTASVTKKWYKISRSCETLLDLQERAIKVWVPLEWRLDRVLGKAGGALAIVGMGLDIWKIMSTGKDISNGSKSELGKGITKHIYIGGGEIAERF